MASCQKRAVFNCTLSRLYCLHLTRFYELSGELLRTVSSAKYLGIIVSNNLGWHNQVCAAAKQANSVLHLLARNFHGFPKSTRALAYTTLVRPKLEYAATVWNPHTKEDQDILERVNRRASRMTYNKGWRERNVSPTELLNQLGWHTLSDRCRQQRLALLYKISNNLIAIPDTRLQEPARTTRGHSK